MPRRSSRFARQPWRVLALWAAVLLGVACGPSNEPILIGLAGSFSDPVGGPMQLGARLAVEEINAAGGIDGRPIALVERDDFANPDSAVFVATDLYNAGVAAVVGHLYSSTTLAAAPVYNGGPNPVVALSPSSSAPAVSAAGPYTFRLCPSDLAHGPGLARWARSRLGYERGAVLYVNDEYGRGVRQTFVDEFARLRGELVSVDPYLGQTPEVDVYLDRIAKVGGVQFILVAGMWEEAAEILRQARRRNIGATILGADGLEGIEGTGPIADGVYFSQAYFPTIDRPANRRFVEAYRKRYPDAGPPNQPAAATYDAIYLLRDVIGRVGTDRRKVRDALAGVGTTIPAFEGVTGRVAFDSAGDVTSGQVYIGVVRNGTVQLAEGG